MTYIYKHAMINCTQNTHRFILCRCDLLSVVNHRQGEHVKMSESECEKVRAPAAYITNVDLLHSYITIYHYTRAF